MDLSANQFTGSLPDPWQQGTGNAAQLTTLYLHSNFLAGALPALALSSLANATLHDNWLTGKRARPVPPQVALCALQPACALRL